MTCGRQETRDKRQETRDKRQSQANLEPSARTVGTASDSDRVTRRSHPTLIESQVRTASDSYRVP
jgi:hypothetical protein